MERCRSAGGCEWLSDNGSSYIARGTIDFAKDIGLRACRTPYRSPQNNGMAEAFVKTFRRDYVSIHRTPDAVSVLDHLPAWFADYDAVYLHSSSRYRSPNEFRHDQINLAFRIHRGNYSVAHLA